MVTTACPVFSHKVENEKREGSYLDPHGGKLNSGLCGATAIGSVFQIDNPSQCAVSLKNQACPFLGNFDLDAITPTTVRNRMKDRGTAQSYRHVCFVHVSAILSAAVDDKKIAMNPCQARSVTKPTPGQDKIVPWTDTRLKAVWLALSPIVQVTIPLGAGAGLRQEEMFGLSPHDIDREAKVIHLVRQVQQVNNALMFCLPKQERPARTQRRPERLRALQQPGSGRVGVSWA